MFMVALSRQNLETTTTTATTKATGVSEKKHLFLIFGVEGESDHMVMQMLLSLLLC